MFTAALRPHGLTPSQAEAITVLSTAGRSLTVKEVGERLVCEQGSPSRLVHTLVEKGLVEASPDERDSRATRLLLTRAGRIAAGQVAEAERQLYALLAGNLDGRTVDVVRGFLRSLVSDLPAGRALARRIADESLEVSSG